MAAFALRITGSRNVRHGLDLRIDRDIGTTMATGALARRDGTGMGHRGRCESRKIFVTGMALGRRRHMTGGLAQGVGAVMTVGTATTHRGRHGRVIEGDRRPRRRRPVAGIALRRRRDVCRRLDLSVLQYIGTTMAGQALPRQPRMVHAGRTEYRGVGVTAIALRSGWNVRHRLAQRIHRHISTSVAGRAVRRSQWPGRTGVAHLGGPEGGVVFVAGIALCCRRNVRCRLSEGGGAIVASRTLSGGRCSVAIRRRCPSRRRGVTGIALVCRRNVG